ncbi:hypothetical protein EDE15_2131 [Edaphobacter aggregans]|uniref:Uncharacterized protein n=1 Tax=Edaphobacter aggregans TaxID=570835 RepID=A0A3R9R2T3_9BACT|nr:hypothetical protein [Edaphobacter aggregans]RSL16610.1 hypothetical protein EDE15_2131 [Edaphobacter aggregans]
MTLLNAPQYDKRKENTKRNVLIGAGVLVLLTAVIGVGGFLLGHGWFFSTLPAEHRVDQFLTALEAKDYDKAYAIWMNDPDWKQHPQKYDYTLKRFTEDWTTESDWGPIKSHHVDISKRTGTGVIVAARVNDSPKKLFMWYEKSNGTLTYPAPYNLEY